MEITFQSKWFEKCIRDFLGVKDRALTNEDVRAVRYLFATTTNSYEIGFSRESLPEKFEFSDSGDEWAFCCVSDTGKYHDLDEFLEIRDWETAKDLTLKGELLEEREPEDIDEEKMEAFENSVKKYEANDSDFDGLEYQEETYDWGILFPDDFTYLTNLEVVRLMDCEREIHSLKFLQSLPKLRILEVGQVSLNTLDGTDRLIGLENLCIWSN